jgi:GntR family transcriptional regulator
LYRGLSDYLKNEIMHGRFAIGTQIPTELDLCSRHKVSRTTVRQAIQHLVAEGLLDRQQGRGTFVVARPNTAGEGLFKSQPPQAAYQFKYISSGWAAASYELASTFGLSADAEIYTLVRLRLQNKNPIAVTRYYTPAIALRDNPPSKKELSSSAFDQILLKRGISLVQTNISAEPTFLSEANAALLGVEAGRLSLSTQRVSFDQHRRAVRLSRTDVRSDRAQLFWSIKDPYGPVGLGEYDKFSVWTRPAVD